MNLISLFLVINEVLRLLLFQAGLFVGFGQFLFNAIVSDLLGAIVVHQAVEFDGLQCADARCNTVQAVTDAVGTGKELGGEFLPAGAGGV